MHNLSICATGIATSSSGQHDGWIVDVLLDDSPIHQDLTLVDPFSQDEELEFRWYLEDYLKNSPFEITRASNAATELQRYSFSLFNQLRLVNLRVVDAETTTERNVVLQIKISESNSIDGNKHTIHRLHWETLESSELWKLGSAERVVEASVCRVINMLESSQGSQGSSNVPMPLQSDSTANVLLITARDLRLDATKQQDIDPTLVSSKFFQLQQELAHAAGSKYINLEIARPGTFSALKQHLEKRGPDYFHMIHFDLHGRVIKRRQKGTEQACLLFASEEDSYSLWAVTAEDLAESLAGYRIRTAVLTSCDSARANCSGETNLAETLVRCGGITHVIAMSFKISSTAVATFSHALYRCLYVWGSGTVQAVTDARRSLQTDQERPARFGRVANLNDWIVPVLYTSDTEQGAISRRSLVSTSRLNRGKPSEISPPISKTLLRRDYDILRFERQLIENNIIYLTGIAGVGKTCLIEYMSDLWQATNFVEALISVDLKRGNIHNLEEFAQEILRQLQTIAQIADSYLHTLSSIRDDVVNRVKMVLKKHKLVLIIDGVDSLSVSSDFFLSDTAGSWLRHDLPSFLKEIYLEREIGIKNCVPHLILVGRNTSPSWWNQRFGEISSTNASLFRLDGLRLPDAIAFSRSILQQAPGADQALSGEKDHEILDQIIILLQRNPLTLRSVLPLAKRGLRKLLGMLLRGPRSWLTLEENVILRPQYELEISQWTILEEMDTLVQTLPPGIVTILKSLVLFWNEGPLISSWGRVAEVLVGQEEISTLSQALMVGSERGWLSVQDDVIGWMHPLFNIYMHTQICLTYWSPFARYPALMKGPSEPANILRRGFFALEKLFIKNVEIRGRSSFAEEDITGRSFPEICKRWRRSSLNILSCLRICSSEYPAIPLKEWPFYSFGKFAPFSRQILSASETLLYVDSYENLLHALFRQNGGKGIPQSYQDFAWRMLNHLFVSHQSEVPAAAKRTKEFSDLAAEVLDATRSTHGLANDLESLYQISLSLKYRAFYLLNEAVKQLQDSKYADEAWNAMLEIDSQIYDSKYKGKSRDTESPGPTGTSIDTDFLNWAVGTFGKNDLEVQNITERLKSRPTIQLQIASSWRELKHSSWVYMKSLHGAAVNGQADIHNILTSNIQEINNMGRQLRQVSNGYREAGTRGFSSDPRWYPENFDMMSHFGRLINSSTMFSDLEKATDQGDWVVVAKKHQDLSDDALRAGKIKEAVEHMDSLIEALKKSEMFSTELIDAQNRRKALAQFSKAYELCERSDRLRFEGNLQDSALLAHEAIDIFKSSGVIEIMTTREQKSKHVNAIENLKELTTNLEWLSAQSLDENTSQAQRGEQVAQDNLELGRLFRRSVANWTSIGRKVGFAERDQEWLEWTRTNKAFIEAMQEADFDTSLKHIKRLRVLQDSEVLRNVSFPHIKSMKAALHETELKVLRFKALRESDLAAAIDLTDELIAIFNQDCSTTSLDGTGIAELEAEKFQYEMEWLARQDSTARQKGDLKESVRVLKDIVERCIHTDLEVPQETISEAMNQLGLQQAALIRLLDALRVQADHDDRFEDALNHAQEMWEICHDTSSLTSTEMTAWVEWAKENAEIRLHGNKHRQAEESYDFATALQHLQELELICDRRQLADNSIPSNDEYLVPEQLPLLRMRLQYKKYIFEKCGPNFGRSLLQGGRHLWTGTQKLATSLNAYTSPPPN